MTTLVVQHKPRRRTKVPAGLVYETLNGRPLYYKGYKDVLSGQKTPEAIMGSSSLQAALVTAIVLLLGRTINRKKYLIVTNEAGLHIGRGSNFANDVAIYDREGLTLGDSYFKAPPNVVIEVDIRVDLEGFAAQGQGYMYEKTEKLLEFGVEQVIWITTQPRKVFVASRNAHWITHNWDVPVALLNGIELNLAALVEEEGIQF